MFHMPETHQFVRVDFIRFKAFSRFTLSLRHFNILVGPNNAGKSTVLTAFRILAAAMRRAGARKAEMVRGPEGRVYGYLVDLRTISVAEENIFYNYDESEPASVVFTLSNQNTLQLYFPERGTCYLVPDAQGRQIFTPTGFRSQFNCPIGFVPILGPVEHNEPLYREDAARLALFSYQAARNFRNIWYHYPQKFEEFRAALASTWPGMAIEPPEIERMDGKAYLYMFCPEGRIPREIFWSGFGFQVWCQMLTHLLQSREMSLFLIDEPDIYLHSDLQRQLLGLLRDLGPDILVATHSTEIITEAETNDIVLIDKRRRSGRRIRDPSQLGEVFEVLGSNLNPILTQLAKTRRALFLEGKDFQILGRFARKLGFDAVANRRDFAVVPVEGFNPERIRNLKLGMEETLGRPIAAAAVMDKDYRSDGEREAIISACEAYCRYTVIHKCKEIENFLLVPAAIDRAAERRVADHARRTGATRIYSGNAAALLSAFAEQERPSIMGRYIGDRRRFERTISSHLADATIGEAAVREFERCWGTEQSRLEVIPGKDALRALNQDLQEQYGVNVTAAGIVDAMRRDEVPAEMVELIQNIANFSALRVD
jgi:energy-coupling factor transporter ATP-binding protein EcfA2